MKLPKPVNPFYSALVVVGVAFALTACCYTLMILHGRHPHHAASGGLLRLMEQRGLAILLLELAALGCLTVAAMSTDSYWIKHHQMHRQPDADPESHS